MVEKILPVTITEKALEKIAQIRESKNIPDFYGLRIGVKGGGGCGGFSFVLGFDQRNEEDDEFEVTKLKLYIEKKQLMYVAGKMIDYIDSEDAQGFVFS